MILLTHPAQIYQADSKNKDLGKSYMIQDKAIKILQLTVGVAKYCVCVCVTRVSMRCPKFRFPIGVIVFDELELISVVSQGLTLSTASLVYKLKFLLFLKVSLTLPSRTSQKGLSIVDCGPYIWNLQN